LPGTSLSFELRLGTRWVLWLGVVMVVMSIGFFLKYAYDNDWIGPSGRIAIGTVAGLAALGVGERFRRKGWPILFQGLSGLGIAALYLCIYFAFQVYHLSGQELSFALAILLTVLSIVMAVVHQASAIAILGMIGGFLSPVLLSTGENHPYVLFTYITILNLGALAAAYYRRWRALDVLCMAGTFVLYATWYEAFYGKASEPSQLVPALLYLSVFYLIFLIVPIVYSLLHRLPETVEGVVLIAVNALYTVCFYYNILYADYRMTLGFVVLAQAALVFALYVLWSRRLGRETRTAQSLMVVALGLVTLAIPIQLRFYAVPLAWAIEGVVLTYLAFRFRQAVVHVGAGAALVLSVGGLIYRLPLHEAPFTPVLNIAFGSWLFVAAGTAVAAWLWLRQRPEQNAPAWFAGGVEAVAAFALVCIVLTIETCSYWLEWRPQHYMIHLFSSLVLLWAAIPAAVVLVAQRTRLVNLYSLGLVCYTIGLIVFSAALPHYRLPSQRLLLHSPFAAYFMLAASLWWGAWAGRALKQLAPGNALAVAGHVVLAVLVGAELLRWGYYSSSVTEKFAVSVISAAWAVHAFLLVWFGLVTQNQPRRILGFVLFAVVVAKVWLLDLSALEAVYRILSYGASGLLLIVLAYFYHRYSARLLGAPSKPMQGTDS